MVEITDHPVLSTGWLSAQVSLLVGLFEFAQ